MTQQRTELPTIAGLRFFHPGDVDDLGPTEELAHETALERVASELEERYADKLAE